MPACRVDFESQRGEGKAEIVRAAEGMFRPLDRGSALVATLSVVTPCLG